jgi:2-haloacid dehalogenase
MTPRPQVTFFDVNETLLDLSGLGPFFVEVFGSAEPMGEWFVRTLHGSLVANHVGNHRPFELIGAEALMVLAQKRGYEVDPARAAEIVESMRNLPVHPDVPAALDTLRVAGFRLVALTNSSSDAVSAQLIHAGIAERFERAISVDSIGRFKPSPDVYLHAAMQAGVDIDRAVLVAAHDWDIVGARSVGMPGAFVARSTVVWGMPDNPPSIVAADLTGVSDQLLALE